MTAFALPLEFTRLPTPYRDELPVVNVLAARLKGEADGGSASLDWAAVIAMASPWVQQVRDNPAPFWAMESLLREYPITSAEGLALMRLAEALLRVPDAPTAIALTADQLGRAQFDGGSEGPHKMLASLSSTAISLSKKFLPEAEGEGGLLQRLGAQTVVAATVRAIQLLGRQFVLGQSIKEAMHEADSARRQQKQLRFSYDMLGEGARTEADAARYQASYLMAIDAIAKGQKADSPEASDGISIKLSALFSRYEVLQRERVFAELLPRVWQLIERAAKANINLTIDAEEVDRLELSLEVLDALAGRIALQFPQWRGFGLAVQAYQTRALAVVNEVAGIARKHGLRFMVRLVKGAYWDGEIKRAQELGLEAYPVFTHKQHTDVSYLACAQALISHADVIYPQFASHNAGTIAAIVQMARKAGAAFEMQRLHGMGEGVYRELLKDETIPCRVYAPVGEHRDLLAYLVRRLLENGANSSFVHQLADASVDVHELLASPLAQIQSSGALPLPADLFRAESNGVPAGTRQNSSGLDLTVLAHRQPLLQALDQVSVQPVPLALAADCAAAMQRLQSGFAAWNARGAAARAAILRRAADALDARLPEFCALLVKEAFKTQGDCMAEVREAVDFMRYYADEAEAMSPPQAGRGVFVCISPWNFPLAIFAGQVVAALVAGNTVAAKPAEQTPYVAQCMVELLHEAGVPTDALVLLHGPGETVGAALVADPHVAGVCFTGSTAVAQIINRSLAAKSNAQAVPLIAETGGINAMVVDSTALPEQVVDAVVQSAFRSAGQRCSALRLLCVHEGIADGVIEMLRGALQGLTVGEPAMLATDVGPVIDDEAFQNISQHVQRLKREARLIGESPVHDVVPRLIRPAAFEIARVGEIGQEIFGPVLHVLRWTGEPDALIEQINSLGYGLTLGIQTRIDSRALRLAERARVGNIYVNRNIIGAVVGVQPFGGEGMSGTGPKAGGPHYLRRFVGQGVASAPVGQAASRYLADEGRVAPGAAWQQACAAQPTWAERPLAERVVVMRRMAAQCEPAQAALWLAHADQAEQGLVPRALPGPTGERNELRQHPRGALALFGAGADASQLHGALAAALVGGNGLAVLPGSVAVAKLLADAALKLKQAGLNADVLVQLDDHCAKALLSDAALAGVVVAGTDAGLMAELQVELAQRRGAILPLISADECRQASNQYRFVTEQTLTINTAAAGGNAELLAGLH
ncbi:MAG: bifunctional proline dehydrogenase/L-glutamate gamma-semialdehyde dehydrogenase PutA [Burkholderiaceae bacterium]|nr:bifunctional proline dehydrogenase/L-glutamate gamma-semialdehyde dehydrogenase PutA [Burkholderiaceae bacterium]